MLPRLALDRVSALCAARQRQLRFLPGATESFHSSRLRPPIADRRAAPKDMRLALALFLPVLHKLRPDPAGLLRSNCPARWRVAVIRRQVLCPVARNRTGRSGPAGTSCANFRVPASPPAGNRRVYPSPDSARLLRFAIPNSRAEAPARSRKPARRLDGPHLAGGHSYLC